MKKPITFIIALLMAITMVSAQDVDTSQPAVDITKMSQTELSYYQKGLIAQKKAQGIDVRSPIVNTNTSAEQLDKYVDVGERIGQAIAGIGKGVGEGGDAFLNSTTGKIAVLAVIWKVMGKDLYYLMNDFAGYLFALVFGLVAYPLWWRTAKQFTNHKVLTSSTGFLFNSKKDYEFIEAKGMGDTQYGPTAFWTCLSFCIITCVICFSAFA